MVITNIITEVVQSLKSDFTRMLTTQNNKAKESRKYNEVRLLLTACTSQSIQCTVKKIWTKEVILSANIVTEIPIQFNSAYTNLFLD